MLRRIADAIYAAVTPVGIKLMLTAGLVAVLIIAARGDVPSISCAQGPPTGQGIPGCTPMVLPIVSAAAEATHVIKASPGNLYGIYATNLTGTAGFLVVLNATAAPADGAIR